MRLLIDGDACPDKDKIKALANHYQIETLVFIDYAHVLDDEGWQVIMCEIGNDSVDQAIVNSCLPGDLVITQDYGLASLVLTREAEVMHVSGKYINEDNINNLLTTRFLSAKSRKAGNRTKGPKKISKDDTNHLLLQLEKKFIEYKNPSSL